MTERVRAEHKQNTAMNYTSELPPLSVSLSLSPSLSLSLSLCLIALLLALKGSPRLKVPWHSPGALSIFFWLRLSVFAPSSQSASQTAAALLRSQVAPLSMSPTPSPLSSGLFWFPLVIPLPRSASGLTLSPFVKQTERERPKGMWVRGKSSWKSRQGER